MTASSYDFQLGELLDLSSLWYWCQDEVHRLTLIAPSDHLIVGCEPSAYRGKALWELSIDEMPQDFWVAYRRALDAHQRFQDVEIQLRGTEGSECFSFTGRPRFNASGQFIGYHGVVRQVTEQVRTLNRLRETERRYRTLVELSPDAILISSGWTVAFVNSAAVKLLGASSADDLIGRPFIELVGPQYHHIVRERAREILFDGRTMPPMEQQAQCLDGSVVDIEVKSAPVFYDGKSAIQAVWRDITERKTREAELHRLTRLAVVRQEELERANRTKSHFLAAASHDLRQPVHAFGLLLEGLRGCALPSDARPLIVELQHTFDSMDALLSALLDISRLDAGVVTPAIENVPVATLFDALHAEFSGAAHTKLLALRIHASRLVVRSDPRLLGSILSNLVANAVRYTERGRVVVGCRRRSNSVAIEVWDTGIGIPADKHQEVFQEFVQLRNPSRDRSQGLGLGLAIVARTANLLGHTVHLRSQPDRGTVFSVLLPLGTLTSASHDATATPALGTLACSVLIVDDEASVRTSIAALLGRWGCQVVAADSGDTAESVVRSTGLQPDILLTDFRLRDAETGLDVIARLRAILGHAIPCALITGDTASSPLQAAEAQGIRLLHKPVRPRALRMLIDELLTERGGGQLTRP